MNEIFDPENVDEFYALNVDARKDTLRKNKATNYSVVRLPLIEGLYEKLYRQKLVKPNPRDWTLFLHANSEICGLEEGALSFGRRPLHLHVKNMQSGQTRKTSDAYDLVVFATGYQRNPTAGILKDLRPLIVDGSVLRNYRLRFHPGSVCRDAGVWLQGSCEGTHGVSKNYFSSPFIVDANFQQAQRYSSFCSCRTCSRDSGLDPG